MHARDPAASAELRIVGQIQAAPVAICLPFGCWRCSRFESAVGHDWPGGQQRRTNVKKLKINRVTIRQLTNIPEIRGGAQGDEISGILCKFTLTCVTSTNGVCSDACTHTGPA